MTVELFIDILAKKLLEAGFNEYDTFSIADLREIAKYHNEANLSEEAYALKCVFKDVLDLL